MRIILAISTSLLFLTAQACAGNRYAGVPEPQVAEVQPPGESSAEAPQRVHIEDSEMHLFPDPRDRTKLRLDWFRRFFIREYEQTHGRLPDRIEDFMPAPGSQIVDFRRDGWGNPFRYRRLDDDYELRSAGPDGRFDTADDMVVTSIRGIG